MAIGGYHKSRQIEINESDTSRYRTDIMNPTNQYQEESSRSRDVYDYNHTNQTSANQTTRIQSPLTNQTRDIPSITAAKRTLLANPNASLSAIHQTRRSQTNTNEHYYTNVKNEIIPKEPSLRNTQSENMNYGHFPPSYGQFPPQYYFPGSWSQNNQEQNHMINQMQHAAATANMYASAGMYDPVTLNPYANDSILNPDAEEECPQCSTKFLRSQGKFDPNNPKNLICATCFETIHPSGGSTYPAVRSLKREKKVKTCPNCKTQTTSLWRKFKSADEVQRELEKKEGGKDREIDSSKPEFEGELGCNPCVLYWKLHGKHRPLELQRDGPLVTRKRKRKEKPFADKYDHNLMHKQYNPMYWPVHQNGQSSYSFFQNNSFLANNVYPTNMVPNDYLSQQARAIYTPVDYGKQPQQFTGHSTSNSPCSSSVSGNAAVKIEEMV